MLRALKFSRKLLVKAEYTGAREVQSPDQAYCNCLLFNSVFYLF